MEFLHFVMPWSFMESDVLIYHVNKTIPYLVSISPKRVRPTTEQFCTAQVEEIVAFVRAFSPSSLQEGEENYLLARG